MKSKIVRALTAEMLKKEVDSVLEKHDIVQVLPTNERGQYLIIYK